MAARARRPGREARVLKILTLGLLAWGCGRSVSTPTAIPSPTPSPDVPIAFVIVAGMNVVGIGATTPFMAKAYPALTPAGLGPTLDVTRQSDWTSSDSSVATVSSSGLVTARGPGGAEIAASYKGKSNSVPLLVIDRESSQSLSRYAGIWSGEAKSTCQRLSGVGRSACDPNPFNGAPQTIQHPIQLTLTVAGGMLTGTLRLYQSPMTGPVQAALLDTRQLAIGGILGGEHGVIVQLREWELSLTRGGRLVGIVIEDRAFVNVYSSQLQRERLEVNLTREE
jgi:hypothetical protein